MELIKVRITGNLALIAFVILMFPSLAAGQQIKRLDGSSITADFLQSKIVSLMDKAKVKGLELTIFNNNKVVYKQAFGVGNDANVPLKTSMNMYGASLSKAVFAVLMMKLFEEGVIDLDVSESYHGISELALG